MIVCHYPGHDELWVRFDEGSVAEPQVERVSSDKLFFGHYFDFPNQFVQIFCRKKLPDVPALNRGYIEKEVKSRLSCFEDLNLSSLTQRSGQPDVASLGKVFPLKREQWFYVFYYGKNDDPLPTLLPTSSLCGVHNVLVGLHSLRGRFDHTTNIKKEGNSYYFSTSEKIVRLSEL